MNTKAEIVRTKDLSKTDKQLLINAALELGQDYLSKLENEIILGVLVDNLTFSQVAMNNQLTVSRVKIIYQNAVKRLLDNLSKIAKRIREYNELSIKNRELESKLAALGKGSNLELVNRKILDSLPMKMQDTLCTKIADTSLSTRTKHICGYSEIYTVLELVKYSKNELLQLRNCGNITITELEKFYEEHGLKFKMF